MQPTVTFASNHLRSSIARATTCCLQCLILFVSVGQAEVNDFDVVFVVQQQILRLQIPVADLDLMNVLNTRYDLLEELAALLLLQAFPLHYIVEELTTACILHDQEQLF